HLRVEQRLEHLGELLRTDDRDHQLHDRPPSVSSAGDSISVATAGLGVPLPGRIRIAPSSRAYASSPCWLMSRPRPSSRAAVRSPATAVISLSRPAVIAALNRIETTTASAWIASCIGLPNKRPSAVPFHDFCASTPVSSAPTVPPRPWAATTSSESSS